MIRTEKGELIMLEFLQTGRMLYVLAAICALGTLSKLATGSLYKRLIKETGNMALAKDKNLKTLKQRMENVFLINHGIRNVNAYIEKQLYGFRFLHVSLDGWDKLSVQAMILCFMVGGVTAFGAYWYRCDNSYIVLYGAAGVFSGLFLAFVDNWIGTGMKRKQLADHLVDYHRISIKVWITSFMPDRSGKRRWELLRLEIFPAVVQAMGELRKV